MKLTLTAILAAIPVEQSLIPAQDLLRGVAKQIGKPISYKNLCKFLDYLYDITPQQVRKETVAQGELPFYFAFEREKIAAALAAHPEATAVHVKTGRPKGIPKITLQLRIPETLFQGLALEARGLGLDTNEHIIALLMKGTRGTSTAVPQKL